MEIVSAKYGVSKTFMLPLIEYGATDFKTGVTLATGDVKISKNGAAFTNIATLPTIIGAWMKITLSATEMQAAYISVQIIDQTATKIFEDTGAIINTDILNLIWDEPLTGATHNVPTSSGRRLRSIGDVVSGSVNDLAATAISFITDLAGTYEDHYADQTLHFTSGNLEGISRSVLAYDEITKELTIEEPLPVAPANGDDFDLNPVHVHPVSQIVGETWDEVLTSGAHNVNNSSGKILRELKESPQYEGGFIYFDSLGGVAGDESFINGVLDNPVNNETDLITLKANLGIRDVKIIAGSTLSLTASHEKQNYNGETWTLSLGNQSVSGSNFHGAAVDGICTGAIAPKFEHCEINGVTSPPAHYDKCGFNGAWIAGSAGNYYFADSCHSSVAGTGTPSFDFNSITGTNFNFRGYYGGMTIKNMVAGCNMSFDGDGQIIIDASCTGGTIRIAGHQKLTGGAAFVAAGGVIDDDARFAIDQIKPVSVLAYPAQALPPFTTRGQEIEYPRSTASAIPYDLDTDITGKTVKFMAKLNHTDSDANATIPLKDITAYVTDDANGLGNIVLTEAETDIEEARYYAEVQVISAGAVIQRFLFKLSIIHNVIDG